MKIRTSAKMVPNLLCAVTQESQITTAQPARQKNLLRQSQNSAISKANRKKDRKQRAPKNFLQDEDSSQQKSYQAQNKQNLQFSSFSRQISTQQLVYNQEQVQIKQKPKLLLDLHFEQQVQEKQKPETHEEISQEVSDNNENLFNVNLKRLHLLDWASDNEGEQSKVQEAVVPFEQDKITAEKQIESQPQSQLITKERVFEQIPQGRTLKCFLRRDKKNAEGVTEYNLYFQHNLQHVMTVKKEGMWKYSIYLRQARPGPHFLYDKVATLSSTFFGNNYSLIKTHEKYSSLTVSYETNFLGLNGPRKMQIYIPKNIVPFEYLNECEDDSQWKNHITKFANKEAVWDQKLNAYTLNFKGRALKSSIKNFVITDEKQGDNFFIIFAKAGYEIYNLDISYPFSLIQGIAVAISSFQRKLTCD